MRIFLIIFLSFLSVGVFASDPYISYDVNHQSVGTEMFYTFYGSILNDVDNWTFQGSATVVDLDGESSPNRIHDVKLVLVWHNVKENASSRLIRCYYDIIGNPMGGMVQATLAPLTLNMPRPSFQNSIQLSESGFLRRVRCYESVFTVSVNDYKNTEEGFDNGMDITDEFEWTLPSGWQTTNGKSGTFIDGSSIEVSKLFTLSQESITARAKAGNQFSEMATLFITQEVEIAMSGPNSLVCGNETSYTVENIPGATYQWSLPSGWIGNSNSNSINVTANGASGEIAVSVNACNTTISSQKSVTVSATDPNNQPFISGSDVLCSGSELTVNNVPSGASITWSTCCGVSLSSAQGANPCTFNVNDNCGNQVIQATITTVCGNSVTCSKAVWVGTPSPNELDVFNSNYNGQDILVSGENNVLWVDAGYSESEAGITDYDWDFSSSWDHWEQESNEMVSVVYVPYFSSGYETFFCKG